MNDVVYGIYVNNRSTLVPYILKPLSKQQLIAVCKSIVQNLIDSNNVYVNPRIVLVKIDCLCGKTYTFSESDFTDDDLECDCGSSLIEYSCNRRKLTCKAN